MKLEPVLTVLCGRLEVSEAEAILGSRLIIRASCRNANEFPCPNGCDCDPLLLLNISKCVPVGA